MPKQRSKSAIPRKRNLPLREELKQFKPLDAYEAAALAGCSYHHIHRAVENEELPAYRIGRLLRIKVADLMKWLESTPYIKRHQPREKKANRSATKRRAS